MGDGDPSWDSAEQWSGAMSNDAAGDSCSAGDPFHRQNQDEYQEHHYHDDSKIGRQRE
jgi:hypothetical protein